MGGASGACMLSEIIISGVIKALDGILYRFFIGWIQKEEYKNWDSSNRTSKSKAHYRICNKSFNVASAALVTCKQEVHVSDGS